MGTIFSSRPKESSSTDFGPAVEDSYNPQELQTARIRAASAVEIPPAYHDAEDTFLKMGRETPYSHQVPPVLRQPRSSVGDATSENTMVLLGVSQSMNYFPSIPLYHEGRFLHWMKAPQPEGKVLAKAILRRFVTAAQNNSAPSGGINLVTSSSEKMAYIGDVHPANFDQLWQTIDFTGEEHMAIMPGWRECKRWHSQGSPWRRSAMLRLLVYLDAIPKDLPEFARDLLETPWALVTIFLSGASGSLIHHCGAIKLQEMQTGNPRITFVSAQGQVAERYVVHELLKGHLGSDLSFTEFESIEGR